MIFVRSWSAVHFEFIVLYFFLILKATYYIDNFQHILYITIQFAELYLNLLVNRVLFIKKIVALNNMIYTTSYLNWIES